MESSLETSTTRADTSAMSIGLFCMHCGQRNMEGGRFCSSCGQAAGTAPNLNDTTSTEAEAETPDAFKLRHALGYYLGALGITVLSAMVFPPITPFVYLVSGIVMARVVMRRLVEWHPVYNTLHNLVSAKLGMVALWPFQMLSLLVKLGINRAL
jgi:hypothetical protein